MTTMDDFPDRFEHQGLEEIVDAEIHQVESSLDPADADEPEAKPLGVRLSSLRSAIDAMEAYGARVPISDSDALTRGDLPSNESDALPIDLVAKPAEAFDWLGSAEDVENPHGDAGIGDDKDGGVA